MKGLQLKYRGIPNAMKKNQAATDKNKEQDQTETDSPKTGKLKLSGDSKSQKSSKTRANTRVKTVWKIPKKDD